MSDLAPSSGLSHLSRAGAAAMFAGEGVALREEPGLCAMLLFDKSEDSKFRRRVARTFGAEPPTTPNTVAVGASAIAWIAPGQWLVIGGDPVADGLDVSDAYCAISVKGRRAADLLSKSVPVDLDVKAFAALCCARTVLGSIPIFLMARDESDFLLLVERGLAYAAWAWLVDGASPRAR